MMSKDILVLCDNHTSRFILSAGKHIRSVKTYGRNTIGSQKMPQLRYQNGATFETQLDPKYTV
jgi:hypothetical protein